MATQNNLFAFFDASKPDAIKERLAAPNLPFPILSQSVSADSWFLVTKSTITTMELSDALGVTDGSTGSGIIVRVENYFGRADTSIWEWIVAKRGIELGSSTE